jgi:cobalt/nickel transport protein
MRRNIPQARNRIFIAGGLGVALLIAVFVSPLASKKPDGLDRVSKDLKFNTREAVKKPAHQLPFHSVFNEYAVRGVPKPIATPLAGLLGTLATFGLTLGIGKWAARGSSKSKDSSQEHRIDSIKPLNKKVF